jgi:hypothetical protein
VSPGDASNVHVRSGVARARAKIHSNTSKTGAKLVIATKPVTNRDAGPAVDPGCDPEADESSDSKSGFAAEDLADAEVEVEEITVDAE